MNEWVEALTGLAQTFNVGSTQISIGGNGSVNINGRNRGTGGPTSRPISRPSEPNLPAADEKRNVGKTELVYYENVSPRTRDALEVAVSRARQALGAKNLAWIMDTRILIKTSAKWTGTYEAHNDSLWITPSGSTDFLVRLLVHEFGHRFHTKRAHGLDYEISSKYSYCMANDRSVFVSDYSRTNREEFWAEHFAGWVMGSMPRNRLGPWVGDMIAKYNR